MIKNYKTIAAIGITGLLTTSCICLDPNHRPTKIEPSKTYDLCPEAEEAFLDDYKVIESYERIDFFGANTGYVIEDIKLLDQKAEEYKNQYCIETKIEINLEKKLKN